MRDWLYLNQNKRTSLSPLNLTWLITRSAWHRIFASTKKWLNNDTSDYLFCARHIECADNYIFQSNFQHLAFNQELLGICPVVPSGRRHEYHLDKGPFEGLLDSKLSKGILRVSELSLVISSEIPLKQTYELVLWEKWPPLKVIKNLFPRSSLISFWRKNFFPSKNM